MSLAKQFASKFLVLALILLLPVKVSAFGAGDIPDFAYLNDKAFRHGDIENVLEELIKTVGGAAMGSGLLGIASSVISQVTGGSKFSKSDIKKVYFGNWLRDYSQAMDIAGLSKLTADSLVLVVAVLGFMTFGFSTQEFEVTEDRLGVYLPVEHIDNPKGYAEREGDARQFHPKLRPPVQREELEIDERTGMKKYMATENKGWDTSTAFIRRTFRSCIERGRRARGNEGPDLWEAFRLLGTGLHTMEDLLAHSNWCEIALRKMGHKNVFCHVGDNVFVNTPHGAAPPLVTGTFGSADFLHSLLGEAGDKLSQASVTDLSTKLNNASGSKPDIGILKALFKRFGGGDDQKMNKGEEIQQQAQAYHLNPDNVAPPEVKQKLVEVLKWHDDVMRDITSKIAMIPGLTSLVEEFSNALNEFIYTTLAPYIVPILTTATSALDEGSKLVIDNDDQYEVFNNSNAHDPSHSLLSKDHFGLILNEPAGKIAIVVVRHTVNLIVQAWCENSNPDEVIDRILEAFHHPYYATGRSEIQNKMFDEMRRWMGGLGGEAQDVIQSLTKDAVRNHQNKRKGLEEVEEPGYVGCGHNKPSYRKGAGVGYGSGASQDQSHEGYTSQTSSYGKSQSPATYSQPGRPDKHYKDHTNVRHDDVGGYGNSGYSSQQGAYSQSRDDTRTYATGNPYSGADRRDAASYESNRPNEKSGYGSQHREDPPHGSGYRPTDVAYSGGRREDPSYGGGQTREDDYGKGYGSNKRRDDDDSRGYGASTPRQGESHSYGSSGNLGYGQNQTPHGGYVSSRPQTDSSSYGIKKQGKDDDRRGKSGRDNDSDDDKRDKQGRSGRDDGYNRSRKDKEDSDDDEKRKYGKHKNRSRDRDDDRSIPSYGQASYSQPASASGYAPSYGETYGVERLNVGGRGRDADDDGRKKQYKGGY